MAQRLYSSGIFLEGEVQPKLVKQKCSRGDAQCQEKLYRPEFSTQQRDQESNDKIWELMAEYLDTEKSTIQKNIVSHVEYTLARTRFNFDKHTCFLSTALSVKDRLIES